MDQVVVFEGSENLLINYLDAALADRGRGQQVGTRVPTNRPGQFIRLMVTGGGRLNLLIDRPWLTVEAWDEKESAAEDTAQLCRGLVCAANHHEDGFQVADPAQVSAPVNLPDPDSGHFRYTFTTPVDISGRPV